MFTQWIPLLLFPLVIRTSPVDDIAAQWARTPWNHQNDDDVCPDYKTCSSNGRKYWETLQNTISQVSPTDRTDGKPLFDTLYESETIPLGKYGEGIRPDLQNHGLDYSKMTLWASSSKDPETGEVAIDAAYGNILDTANGVIIAVENFREFDEHRKSPDSDAGSDAGGSKQHEGLPWSEIMYQTWQRTRAIEDAYAAQKKPGWLPGADLSTFKYSIQHKIDNPQTQKIINLAYRSMGYPATGKGDKTWRRWTMEQETRNWFFALLGTDN
ncbi:MAG: hypothetical protein Q9225_005768, partial [Loekoesia sp. 1 TL-2023]